MKWARRLKLMRASKIIISVTLAAIVAIAGVSLYGDKIGNFVVSVDNQSEIKLSLTKFGDFSNQATTISFEGLNYQDAATLTHIPSNITDGIGSKTDKLTRRYIAFSFYLINGSDKAIDYDFNIIVNETVGTMLDMMRIMVFVGEDTTGTIYAKPESSDEGRNQLSENTTYVTTDFLSDILLVSERMTNLEPDGYVKYTLVLWMEGWDIDCNDSALNSKIKIKLEFVGY